MSQVGLLSTSHIKSRAAERATAVIANNFLGRVSRDAARESTASSCLIIINIPKQMRTNFPFLARYVLVGELPFEVPPS